MPPLMPTIHPIPETWGWEWEYLVTQLFDYLNICKMYNCLVVSTDLANAGLGQAAITRGFQQYLILGSKTFHKFLLNKFPIHLDKKVYFQTATMVSMIHACCVDDRTLGHVFDLLRVAELLENHITPLATREKAKVICAIIGELYSLMYNLKQQESSNSAKISEFLDETVGYLLDLLTDTGRDRATYIRQKYTRLSIVPPFVLNTENIYLMSHQERQYLPAHCTKEDAFLSNLILSGSLISVWNRTAQLWNAVNFRTLETESDEMTVLQQLTYDKIVLSFKKTLQHIPRYRRIFLIRFLEMLCSSASGSSVLAQGLTYPPPRLVAAVVEGFIGGSAGSPFPYETETQKKRILSSTLIPANLKEDLSRLLVHISSPYMASERSFNSEAEISSIDFPGQEQEDIDRGLFGDALRHLLP